MTEFNVGFEKVRIATRLNHICSLGQLSMILRDVEKGKYKLPVAGQQAINFRGKNGKKRQVENGKKAEYEAEAVQID